MKRERARISGRTGRSTSDVRDAREYLERLARILVHGGQSPKTLQREFIAICRELREPKESWDTARQRFVSDLPHVLTHWRNDPQYLDSRGSPVALPMKGAEPNLHSLVRRVMPEANVSEVVGSLVELKGIRRRGRLYAPTDWHLIYSRQPTSAFEHGLTALLGMLRTIERNISSPSAMRLFERTATNPRFPQSALRSFHARFNKKGGDFLEALDRSMRRREAGRSPGPRTRLGVGLFVFEEPSARAAKGAGRATRRRPKKRWP